MPQTKGQPKLSPEELYARQMARMAVRHRAASLAGREIGELPKVKDPKRKAKCRRDFRRFCEAYFPNQFTLAWSDDHLKVIAKIEHAILEGGLFANAMPRGSGKSTLLLIACLWATSYGHRRFVLFVAAELGLAKDSIDAIKTEIETNDRFAADFPEICYPVAKLDGMSQRAHGQLYHGKRTRISWTEAEIIFPTIPDSPASGAMLAVSGITGSMRGMKHQLADGFTIRPDMVLIDDPQTRESSRSPSQCAEREAIIQGDILGLAGPGQAIACLAAVTVIRADDLADRLLDSNRSPQWRGERAKMIYAFPRNEKLWGEYHQLWKEGQETGDISKATAFYRKNRTAMDEGAVVGWPARKAPGELSALQHAMNTRYQKGDVAFFAEYQNDPLPDTPPDEELLTADEICHKINGLNRATVPLACSHLVAFIDAMKPCLMYAVAGFGPDFSGAVIDYGAEPDQKTGYFALRDVRRTLAMAAPGGGLEGAIYAGLERLTSRLLSQEWKREDGAVLRIERCLIDANWGDSTDVIYQFCRQSPHAALLTPSHGFYIGARSKPLNDYNKKPGDRTGLNWRIPGGAARAVRHITFDSNFWKSFLHGRLGTRMGDAGCLSLYGHKPEAHRMIAEHLTSEYRVQTQGRGRQVSEWMLRIKGGDNHLLDALVGCCVAASMQGVTLPGTQTAAPKRKRVSLAEMRQRAQAKRMAV